MWPLSPYKKMSVQVVRVGDTFVGNMLLGKVYELSMGVRILPQRTPHRLMVNTWKFPDAAFTKPNDYVLLEYKKARPFYWPFRSYFKFRAFQNVTFENEAATSSQHDTNAALTEQSP